MTAFVEASGLEGQRPPAVGGPQVKPSSMPPIAANPIARIASNLAGEAASSGLLIESGPVPRIASNLVREVPRISPNPARPAATGPLIESGPAMLLDADKVGRPGRVEAELFRWLQKLDPKNRRIVLLRHFSEAQRLALERWFLRRKVSHARRSGLYSVKKALVHNTKTKAALSNGRAFHLERSGPKRIPRSGSRGVHVCTKGGQLRYCASASIGPFLVTSRYLPDLSQVQRCRVVLDRIQARMETTDRPDITEQVFCAALEEETSCLGPDITKMDLRFSVTVMAKHWVGTALKTPQFAVSSPESLQAGLRAYRLLKEARNSVYTGKTNRHSIFQRHSPEELENAWRRIRKTYLAVWAEAGFCSAKVAARLAVLEQRHRPHRLRLIQRWEAKQGQPGMLRNLSASSLSRTKQEDPESYIHALLARWDVQPRMHARKLPGGRNTHPQNILKSRRPVIFCGKASEKSALLAKKSCNRAWRKRRFFTSKAGPASWR